MIEQGMVHQSSYSFTPQQNKITDRKNRHLMEVARALLFQMEVPKIFRADVVYNATYLINHMPSSIFRGKVPFFVHDIRPQTTKLDPKALKCAFLSYSHTKKGYRCFSLELGWYLVSLDVTFFENTSFFSKSQSSLPTCDSTHDFLIYIVTYPMSPAPAKPPIT